MRIDFSENGKVVITTIDKNKKEIKREFDNIFIAIRSYIHILEKELNKEKRNQELLETIIQKTSFLISLKKNELKEIERALIELKALENSSLEERSKLSVINRVFARFRNTKVLGLKEMAEEWMPLFNRKENIKDLDQNIKKFIEAIEKKREALGEEERKIEKERETQLEKEKYPELEKNYFIVKTKNKKGGELYVTFFYDKELKDVKIVSCFVREEKLLDYDFLIPDENSFNIIREAIIKLKQQEK